MLGQGPLPEAPPLGMEPMEALKRHQTPASLASAPHSQLSPQQQHLSLLPQWWQGLASLLVPPPSLCLDASPFQALFLQKALVQQPSCCQTAACSQTCQQQQPSHRCTRPNCPSKMDGNWHPPLAAALPVLLVQDLHVTRRGLEPSHPYSSSSGTGATEREPRILRLYQQSSTLLFYQVTLIGTPASAPWRRLSLCLVVFVWPWLRPLLQLPLTGCPWLRGTGAHSKSA